jgi:hypothetical protein
MANPLDDIQTLLNAMRDRGIEMDTYRGLLDKIGQSLVDIVMLLERPEAPEADEAPDISPALLEALNRLSIPAPVVNMETMAPIINVLPSTVQMMPSSGAQTVTGSFTFDKFGRPNGFILTRQD